MWSQFSFLRNTISRQLQQGNNRKGWHLVRRPWCGRCEFWITGVRECIHCHQSKERFVWPAECVRACVHSQGHSLGFTPPFDILHLPEVSVSLARSLSLGHTLWYSTCTLRQRWLSHFENFMGYVGWSSSVCASKTLPSGALRWIVSMGPMKAYRMPSPSDITRSMSFTEIMPSWQGWRREKKSQGCLQ